MSPSAYEWVARFAEELGTEAPDTTEFNALLGLSSIAAHASERKAAPVSCWIAARAGVTPAEAITVARRISRESPGEAAGVTPAEVSADAAGVTPGEVSDDAAGAGDAPAAGDGQADAVDTPADLAGRPADGPQATF